MADTVSTASGERIRVNAAAKINLYLHVTGQRDDGFHLLDSLVAFAGIQDVVSASPAEGLQLQTNGPFADAVPDTDDNLVLRAARLLADEAEDATGTRPGGALLELTKRLPVASGIGGGSADAAATLRALIRLWDLRPDDADFFQIAQALGADVPVCLAGRAAFMSGIGEVLSPAPVLPEAWLVLINDGTPVSTPAVFEARQGGFSEPAPFSYAPSDAQELAAILGERSNDLTNAAITQSPGIQVVLDTLSACEGNLLARMSGSGGTCFGLFADADTAIRATMGVGMANPDWWVKAASLENDANRLD